MTMGMTHMRRSTTCPGPTPRNPVSVPAFDILWIWSRRSSGAQNVSSALRRMRRRIWSPHVWSSSEGLKRRVEKGISISTDQPSSSRAVSTRIGPSHAWFSERLSSKSWTSLSAPPGFTRNMNPLRRSRYVSSATPKTSDDPLLKSCFRLEMK